MPRIRLGTINDLPALRAIESAAAALFPAQDLPPDLAQPASEAQLKDAIASGLLWTAESDGHQVIGFVACERVADCMHIVEMDILPSHGRRGIGTLLLQHVVAHARSIGGITTLTLTTFSHLPWNAPFYAKNGFTPLVRAGGHEHLEAALAAEEARGLKNRIAMARRAS